VVIDLRLHTLTGIDDLSTRAAPTSTSLASLAADPATGT
jgi:hypothetical protein